MIDVCLYSFMNCSEINFYAEYSYLILLAYIVCYIFTRKAAFIVAFLFTEWYAISPVINSINDVNFYLGYAIIYCLLYYYLVVNNERLRTLAAVMLVVLLDVWSSLDATLYPNTETYFYSNYKYFYILVHACLIISIVNFKKLRRFMGDFIDGCASMLGIRYSAAFFMYNIVKRNQ